MPILQHKLVMKSIEALNDEALSLMPDTASNRVAIAPTGVIHATTPLQESAKDAPSAMSANAPLEPDGNHDIMARIDHLLRKLNEDDDVAIAPPADERPQSNTDNMTGDAGDTAIVDTTGIGNPAKPDSTVLSDAVDHADETAKLDLVKDGMAEDTSGKTFSETGDDADDGMFVDDQSGKIKPSGQIQALADIATAIYQAKEHAVDTVVADVSQNNAAPLDTDVLSANVADEVCRTVSAMMIAELPQMIRDAVGEAIRALPADARGQSTPVTGDSSPAKSVTKRKTATTKKALAKKALAKKTGTKKPIAKKATGKKTAPPI